MPSERYIESSQQDRASAVPRQRPTSAAAIPSRISNADIVVGLMENLAHSRPEADFVARRAKLSACDKPHTAASAASP